MASGDSEWRSGKQVAGCVKYLRDHKLFTDVTCVFPKEGDKTCDAHKLILSMRSAVFEAMFFGSMAESDVNVKIEDIEIQIFEMLIGFMYTDTVHLTSDNVVKCLVGAKKYFLDDLVDKCKTFLEKSISNHNICSIFEYAKFFDFPDLQEKCRVYILKNANKVFKTQDIHKLRKESLTYFLAQEDLPTSELDNFINACRWSEEECRNTNVDVENKRQVLGDVLKLIRFPLMTQTEFAEFVSPTKILTNEEMVEMFKFFITRKTTTPGSVLGYPSVPRGALTSGMHVVVPASELSLAKTIHMTSKLSITLQSSHEIKITSLKCLVNFKYGVVVITNAETDKVIGLISPLECVFDLVRGEFLLNVKIQAQSKTRLVFTIPPESKERYVEKYSATHNKYLQVSEKYFEDERVDHLVMNYHQYF